MIVYIQLFTHGNACEKLNTKTAIQKTPPKNYIYNNVINLRQLGHQFSKMPTGSINARPALMPLKHCKFNWPRQLGPFAQIFMDTKGIFMNYNFILAARTGLFYRAWWPIWVVASLLSSSTTIYLRYVHDTGGVVKVKFAGLVLSMY